MSLVYATTQFWGDPLDTSPDTHALHSRRWVLTDLERQCFECTLPGDACDGDPRCPFVGKRRRQQQRTYAARVVRGRARREVDEAVAAIVAEREAT